MTLLRHCQYCGAHEGPSNPFTPTKIVGGLRIGGDSCADRGACMARRLGPSPEYHGGYAAKRAAIVAERKAGLS